MRYDTVIIGGGLSGLVCGIKLQRAGKKCLMVSAGQNVMHFSSGAFEFLSKDGEGKPVEKPLEAIGTLPATHPYALIGSEKIAEYASSAKPFFASCGIGLNGQCCTNSLMLTPMGKFKKVWLALEDATLVDNAKAFESRDIMIVNIKGYLDFNASFIAHGLEKAGAICRIEAFDTPALDRVRTNPTEMRSVNLARVLDKPEVLDALAIYIKSKVRTADLVILPAIFGLNDPETVAKLRSKIDQEIMFVGTMPPSVPGIRSQMLLKEDFQKEGGVILFGDEVTEASVKDGKVEYLKTHNLGDVKIEADSYILATGSFFSKGLKSNLHGVEESVFGLDIFCTEDRSGWYDKDFFAPQGYMGFGVKVDSSLNPSIDGNKIDNLYAIGSVLGGYDPISYGCGAGVAIMTAFAAAEKIANN